MNFLTIKSIRKLGYKPTIDLEVRHSDHNFYANGLVTSNSHSYGYGILAAQTVYLKYKYPQNFFLACLNIASTRSDFLDEFQCVSRELPAFGIKLLPPNIAKSGLGFSLEGANIRFGLAEIKGISDKSLDKLRSFLSTETNSDFQLFNAAKEAKLGIGILSALIQCGALGHEVEGRSKKVLEAQVWNVLTPREKLFCLQNASKYNDSLVDMLRDFLNWADATGKKFGKESRLKTIRKKSLGYFTIYNLNSANELLASYFYELKLLGFSYSTTLKGIFGSEKDLRNLEEIKTFVPNKGNYETVVTVKEVVSGKSKAGNKYLKMKLVDETGVNHAMLLGDKLAKYLNMFEEPKEEDIIYLRGQKDETILWVNEMEVQNCKIYSRLSELKGVEIEEPTT